MLERLCSSPSKIVLVPKFEIAIEYKEWELLDRTIRIDFAVSQPTRVELGSHRPVQCRY